MGGQDKGIDGIPLGNIYTLLYKRRNVLTGEMGIRQSKKSGKRTHRPMFRAVFTITSKSKLYTGELVNE